MAAIGWTFSYVQLPLLRLDEQRDADIGLAQAIDDGGKSVMQARCIQTAFGGAFLAFFGDDAGCIRRMGQRDGQHFLGRRHFEIQGKVGRFLNASRICLRSSRRWAVIPSPPTLATISAARTGSG